MDESRNKVSVGDRIRIKEFDDMADEFGVDRYGDISPSPNVPCFSKHMKKYCDATGTIVGVDNYPGYLRINIDFDSDKLLSDGWTFADYMVIAEQDILSMPDVACLYGA